MSLALLGKTGAATPVDGEEGLKKRWERDELWPVTMEQDPSVMTGKRSSDYSHFCPEVSYDRFGWFASGLYSHGDELDIDAAHRALAQQGASATDWRWTWTDMSPMHYAECPLYSMLDYQTKNAEKSLVDRTIQRLKNRPFISRVVVAGIGVVAAGAAFTGLETIVTGIWRLVSWIRAW